jgi:hypothetical protein
MRICLIVLLCIVSIELAAAGWSEVKPESGLHPQDGPDVDVRIGIEEERVRVTLILNLAFTDEIVDAVREQEFYLHPVEYEMLHEELWEYFHEKLVIAIDGVDVVPVDAGFEVQDADPTLLPLFPLFGAKALIKARLVLDYPVKAPPQSVNITWPAFPPDYVVAAPDSEEIPPVVVTARLFAGGVSTIVIFEETEPEYTWHASVDTYEDRFLAVPEPASGGGNSIPVLSLLLAAGVAGTGVFCFGTRAGQRFRRRWVYAAPLGLVAAALLTGVARIDLSRSQLPSEPEALAIFQPLHANIYRAFDYTDESDVYDALAQSVHGDLLDRLYNEIYRSLIMQEEGGAVARVQSVTPLETELESLGLLPPDDTPGFSVVMRWQVAGAVFHWGHSHHRTNEYQARYNVLATDTGWRIADSQILEQLRVDAEPISPGAGPAWTSGEGEEL